MIRKAVFTILALIVGLAILAMVPHTDAKPIAIPTPTATPTLPRCAAEDGAGQAECAWYSKHLGHDIISGDCALDITGDKATHDACMELHTQKSFTYETGTDGSFVTQPNGADLVAECNGDAMHAEFDKAFAKELSNDGWNLMECYKAWLE